MPIYEYQCRSCQAEFELLVRSRDQQARCPHCGSTALQWLPSVPAAHTHRGSLPICSPAEVEQGCGLPGCGQGRCQMQS